MCRVYAVFWFMLFAFSCFLNSGQTRTGKLDVIGCFVVVYPENGTAEQYSNFAVQI
jgi:hypothetical protein